MLGATQARAETEFRAWKVRCIQPWLQLSLYARNCKETEAVETRAGKKHNEKTHVEAEEDRAKKRQKVIRENERTKQTRRERERERETVQAPGANQAEWHILAGVHSPPWLSTGSKPLVNAKNLHLHGAGVGPRRQTQAVWQGQMRHGNVRRKQNLQLFLISLFVRFEEESVGASSGRRREVVRLHKSAEQVCFVSAHTADTW